MDARHSAPILECIAIALIALAAYLFWQSMLNEEAIAETWHTREELYELGAEMRQSWEDQAHLARTYAHTGDERYRQWYQEVIDIREGRAPRPIDYHLVYWDVVTGEGERPRGHIEAEPEPLIHVMERTGLTEAEMQFLRRSEEQSEAVTQMESEALNAVHDGDPAKAMKLLYSIEYLRAKELAMLPMLEFFLELGRRSDAEVARRLEDQEQLNTYFGTVILLLFLLVFSGLLIRVTPRKQKAQPNA